MAKAKAKKKASKKKPAKKAVRKSKSPTATAGASRRKKRTPGDPPDLDPIQTLALYATNPDGDPKYLKELRKKLCNIDNFQDEFEAELGRHSGELQDLNPAQRAFCEGWAYLAEQSLKGASFDKNLVKEIKKHLKTSLTLGVNG